MKKLFILAILILPFFIHAQKKTKIKKKVEPKLFVSANLINQYNNLHITKDFTFETFYKDKNLFETQNTLGLDILFGYKIKEKLDFITGLAYQKYTIKQIEDFLYVACDPTLYKAKTILSAERFVNTKALNIPIEFRYKFYKKNKFALYAILGINLNFLLDKRQSVSILLDNGVLADHPANEKTLPVTNKINIAPIAKIGLRYQVISPLYLKIEPFYTYFVGKEKFLTMTDKTNLFAYGINFGVEYTLKKGR